MRRRELIKALSQLPKNARLGILVGDQYMDIADVVTVGSHYALRCWPADVRDALASDWGIARDKAREIAFSPVPDPQTAEPTDDPSPCTSMDEERREETD